MQFCTGIFAAYSPYLVFIERILIAEVSVQPAYDGLIKSIEKAFIKGYERQNIQWQNFINLLDISAVLKCADMDAYLNRTYSSSF